MAKTALRNAVGRALGVFGWSRDKRMTYEALMDLNDRQLEDIGLTRSAIADVVLTGPQRVADIYPEGAIQTANSDRPRQVA